MLGGSSCLSPRIRSGATCSEVPLACHPGSGPGRHARRFLLLVTPDQARGDMLGGSSCLSPRIRSGATCSEVPLACHPGSGPGRHGWSLTFLLVVPDLIRDPAAFSATVPFSRA